MKDYDYKNPMTDADEDMLEAYHQLESYIYGKILLESVLVEWAEDNYQWSLPCAIWEPVLTKLWKDGLIGTMWVYIPENKTFGHGESLSVEIMALSPREIIKRQDERKAQQTTDSK